MNRTADMTGTAYTTNRTDDIMKRKAEMINITTIVYRTAYVLVLSKVMVRYQVTFIVEVCKLMVEICTFRA
jgi:hypothetical protein